MHKMKVLKNQAGLYEIKLDNPELIDNPVSISVHVNPKQYFEKF